jgi:hypothetical protein
VRAFVGLSSRPVDLKTVSAEAVTFCDRGKYAPGQVWTIEIVNSSRSVARVLQIQVVGVTARPDGSCCVEGKFQKRLSDEDLAALQL